MTSESQWTPDAIRALGPTTDLPTLGAIFECSRWKAYQMARQGKWEQVGIRVLSIGSKYRVVVQSILDVLGYSSVDLGSREATRVPELDQASGLADGQQSIVSSGGRLAPRSASSLPITGEPRTVHEQPVACRTILARTVHAEPGMRADVVLAVTRTYRIPRWPPPGEKRSK